MRSVSGCVVLGGGGHTMEMLEILKSSPCTFKRLNVFISSGDAYSRRAVSSVGGEVCVYEIPRPNEVLKGYHLWGMLKSMVLSFFLVWGIPGEFLLCNGPGLCVPLCISYRILHPRTKIWYIESITRVKTLSLTGKILQWVSDVFIVQSSLLSRRRYPCRIYVPFFCFLSGEKNPMAQSIEVSSPKNS